MFFYILYALIAIVSLGYLYLKKAFSYWDVRHVHYKPVHSIMGNLNGVGFKVHATERIYDLYQEFKGCGDKFFGMFFIHRPVAVITDLDLARTMCVKDFNYFHDRGVYVNEKDDPISAHLFSLSGLTWKNMRNKLSPTFTSGKIKYMFQTVTNVSDSLTGLVNNLSEKHEPVDIKSVCVRYTADVIGSCAFGLECNALKDEDVQILKMSQKIFNPTILQNMKFLFINSFQSACKRMGVALFPRDATNYFMGVVRETVDYRQQNKVERKDFMNILIQIMNLGRIKSDNDTEEQEVGKITFNELAAQAFVFFFAGFETSSTSMTFFLFEMARNADIQERVRSEIKIVLAKHDGKITYEAIHEMPYFEQTINESLRRYPPVPFLIRVANEDYKIEGTSHTFEKGTQIFIPTYSYQNDERVFPNPEKFDPDRFSPENVKNRHPYSFLPFGDGPRICIGMRFAHVQMRVGLANLLTQFKFTLNSKTQLPIRFDPKNANVAAKGGIWLDVEKIV